MDIKKVISCGYRTKFQMFFLMSVCEAGFYIRRSPLYLNNSKLFYFKICKRITF